MSHTFLPPAVVATQRSVFNGHSRMSVQDQFETSTPAAEREQGSVRAERVSAAGRGVQASVDLTGRGSLNPSQMHEVKTTATHSMRIM